MRRLWPLVLLVAFAHDAIAQRLPSNVVPSHYTLWFAPDLNARTFRGRETIHVDIAHPTRSVTLNAAEIVLQTVTIRAGTNTQTAGVALKGELEQATFTVPQALPSGPADIDIVYTGVLNDKLRGFYLSTGPARSYAVSQMEATDARRAFPSFDEPAYKASFDISLMIDARDTAISNGPMRSDRPGPEPGKHTVVFATTAKMSTYLVALLVGDFKCREGQADETPVRVCATPDKAALTEYALHTAERAVKYYDEYFGIRYPFDKLDIVGIPDFSAGAMENAGAITFRERALLVDPTESADAARRTVAEYTTHEIAHQWFGNFVTMQWWDDIWLNEGFATWMEKKAVAALEPEWHEEFAEAQDTQAALDTDTLENTRAIHTNAETPAEINELFDAIAYQKTAAVLRTVEQYVGAEAFRKGVSSYLRKYAYGNATGADFWNEMTRVTGQPIDRIITTFVQQTGAPMLTVRPSCSPGRSALSVHQQRLTPVDVSARRELWTFPACFKADDSGRRCELIRERERIVAGVGCERAFANVDGRGYYVTDYAPDALHALAGSAAGLTIVERMSLVGDEWRLARAGRHRVNLFLDLAAALSSDDTAAVIDELASRLDTVHDQFLGEAQRAGFETWIRGTFGPTLARLGLPGSSDDDENRQGLRSTLLQLVGMTGNDAGVQRQARDLAGRYMADRGSIPPGLAGSVLKVAAVGGDGELYDAYLARLSALGSDPEEYYRYFNALPWFRDPALVSRTLDFALTPAARSQDVAALVGVLMGTPWGSDAAWEFVRREWPALTEKLETFQGLPGLIAGMGSFCSAARADDIRAFFAAHPLPTSQRTIQQQIEQVRRCGELRSRDADALTRWISAATAGTPQARDPGSLPRRAQP